MSTAALTQSSGGDFDILKSTLDSGGGASAGGEFTLTATIGQPNANPQSAVGGEFSINGGFWAAFSDLLFKDGFEDF
jgi:hypothetical protein